MLLKLYQYRSVILASRLLRDGGGGVDHDGKGEVWGGKIAALRWEDQDSIQGVVGWRGKITTGPGRLRWEDHDFKASLGYCSERGTINSDNVFYPDNVRNIF